MDSTQFDRLVRTLSTTPTRRLLLTGLARTTAGTTLAALVAVPRSEDAAAGCRQIGQECASTRQCCRHKHKRRICASNPQISPEHTCCIPEGKRCEFGGQCCGDADCIDTADGFQCGPPKSPVTAP
jgi:hypothetical protein